jgi:CDGSH-type Zn-finger protein
MDKPVEFKVIPNGPIHAIGNFTLIGTNGKHVVINEEAFLCRCGGSNNKPFCDGSHKVVGVRD